jgi:hypothetical protein
MQLQLLKYYSQCQTQQTGNVLQIDHVCLTCYKLKLCIGIYSASFIMGKAYGVVGLVICAFDKIVW